MGTSYLYLGARSARACIAMEPWSADFLTQHNSGRRISTNVTNGVMRIAALGALLAVAACGGGGGSGFGNGSNPGLAQCNPGTQVELARPAPNQYAGNVTSIEIVANGSNNALNQSFGSWFLQVQDTLGDPPFTSNALARASDPGGPHPFLSDFYYSGTLGTTLPAGYTWYVSLAQNQFGYQGCTPYPVQGSFST